MSIVLSRRNLLVGVAATTGCLGLTLSWAKEGEAKAVFGLRVAFERDGTLIVSTGKSEMGQGVLSGYAQIVADEIGADWSRVKAVTGSVHPEFRPPGVGEQITGGSMSIRLQYEALRLAGAAVREMLVAEAAARWRVNAAECQAVNHAVVHRRSNQRLEFAQLAAGAASRPVPAAPQVRPRNELTLTGQSVVRTDIPDKVSGKAEFGIDVRLEGMVYAAIRHAPITGARVAAIRKESIAGRQGVIDVVDLGDAVAVVADTWWRAEQAAAALDVSFTETASGRVTTDSIRQTLTDALGKPNLPVGMQKGDIALGAKADGSSVSADYTMPLLAHVTMEPMTCTAVVTADRCEVFAPTQGQDAARKAASQASGLPEASVTIHTTLMGGAFGRRYEWDFVTQAVKIAKSVQRPVKLVWSREQDVRHDFFRPPAAARVSAKLTKSGRLFSVEGVLASPSANAHAWPGAVVDGLDKGAMDGLLDHPYDIPNQQWRFALVPTHLNVGFWRGVSYSINVPIIERFIDEAALAAGVDPVEFRLRHLEHDPQGQRVLARCAELVGWSGQASSQQRIGIAYGRPMMTPTAVAAVIRQVEGQFKVDRIVAVVDCGRVINPDTVRAQAEGGALFGLSAALNQQIHVDAGAVRESNFHDFPILALAETPDVTVDVIPSDAAPTGIGEPTTPVTMAAVMNAAAKAIARPIRSLPIA